MLENTERVTKRIGGLMGAREIGRNPKQPIEEVILIGSLAKDMVLLYRDKCKYEKGQLTDEDMDKVTENIRFMLEEIAAAKQGIYEKNAKKIVNPRKGVSLQDKYLERETTSSRVATRDDREPEIVNPLDIVYDIANFENKVYDKLMSGVLKEQGLASIDTAGPDKTAEIKKEVENKMDGVVRNIGLNFLRGSIPGIGKYFMGKATKTVQEYTSGK